MAGLGVRGPALVGRSWSAPYFTLIDEPGRWCAVEVAVTPDELGSATAEGERWGSWERGLTPPGQISLPDPVWAELGAADRLYYRAHSSAAADAWVDHQWTVADDSREEAPSFRVSNAWSSGVDSRPQGEFEAALEAAAAHADFPGISAGAHLSALVCLHRFSPKRPMDASQLEWLVLLASESTPPGEVQMLVQRLDYASRSLIASRRHTDAGELTPALGLTAGRFMTLLVGPDASLWPREERGPFLILRNNSPAPEEEGGTCVIIPATGRCVYCAKTVWHGAAEAAMPG